MVTRRRVVVAGLLILSLAVRLVQVQATSYSPVYDAGSYLTLASQVARTGDYSHSHAPGVGAANTRGPSAYFAPGYPYFLAGVDRLAGHTTPRGAVVEPTRISQALLGTLIVALVGLVALEACGPAVAGTAMAMAAIYPVFVELSAILVVENLLTPLILGAVWAALRARRDRTHPYRWILAMGVLLGLATLTHEDAAVTALPLAWAAWSALPGRTLAARLAAPAALLATAVLVIAPWTIRNAIVLHTFIPVSDETGITLRGTYNPTSAHNRAVPYKWRIFFDVPADRAIARKAHTMTEPELNSRLTSRALAYIADNPLAPLRVAYHNSVRLLELEGSFAWRASAYAMGLDRGVAEIGVYSFWALGILALCGAFTAGARRAPPWLWVVPLLLWLSTALVNSETPRFREPVDPFLVILAGCAASSVARRAAARLRPYASRPSAPAGDVGRPATAGRSGPAPAQTPSPRT